MKTDAEGFIIQIRLERKGIAGLMYWIDIMTLFPDVVGDMLCESVLGRGQERGYIRIECHQIRDYTLNKQKQVDDYPYWGGRGAVMQADPLYQCTSVTRRGSGSTPFTCPRQGGPSRRPTPGGSGMITAG